MIASFESVHWAELSLLRAKADAWDTRVAAGKAQCICTHQKKCGPCSEYVSALRELSAAELEFAKYELWRKSLR